MGLESFRVLAKREGRQLPPANPEAGLQNKGGIASCPGLSGPECVPPLGSIMSCEDSRGASLPGKGKTWGQGSYGSGHML